MLGKRNNLLDFRINPDLGIFFFNIDSMWLIKSKEQTRELLGPGGGMAAEMLQQKYQSELQ